MMRKPDFFLVGAPKCGTTAMNAYLQRHRGIFIPHHKEFHFFGSDLNFYLPRLKYDTETYLSFFKKAKENQIIGESSIMYLYSKCAADEISKFNSKAKILIMIRNPIEMMYSFHSQLLFTMDEDLIDFKKALEAEPHRKEGRLIPRKTTMVDYLFYREVATYRPQIERYLGAFGRENVHITVFDDFQRDTANSVREILQFLRVTTDFQTNFKPINPNKRQRFKTLEHFLKTPPNFIRKPIKRLLPLQLRIRMVNNIREMNAKYHKRPPMDSELEKKLKQEFRPEVEKLSKLLGRDLTHWCESN